MKFLIWIVEFSNTPTGLGQFGSRCGSLWWFSEKWSALWSGPVWFGYAWETDWVGMVLGFNVLLHFTLPRENRLKGLRLILWSINFRQHASKIAHHVWLDNRVETIEDNECSSVFVWRDSQINLVGFFRHAVWCGRFEGWAYFTFGLVRLWSICQTISSLA